MTGVYKTGTATSLTHTSEQEKHHLHTSHAVPHCLKSAECRGPWVGINNLTQSSLLLPPVSSIWNLLRYYSDVYHKFECLSFIFNLFFFFSIYLFSFNIPSAANEWRQPTQNKHMFMINIDVAKKREYLKLIKLSKLIATVCFFNYKFESLTLKKKRVIKTI